MQRITQALMLTFIMAGLSRSAFSTTYESEIKVAQQFIATDKANLEKIHRGDSDTGYIFPVGKQVYSVMVGEVLLDEQELKENCKHYFPKDLTPTCEDFVNKFFAAKNDLLKEKSSSLSTSTVEAQEDEERKAVNKFVKDFLNSVSPLDRKTSIKKHQEIRYYFTQFVGGLLQDSFLVSAEAHFTRKIAEINSVLPDSERFASRIGFTFSPNSLKYFTFTEKFPLVAIDIDAKAGSVVASLPISKACNYFAKIAKKISQMHQNGFCHCGLDADNIMLKVNDEQIEKLKEQNRNRSQGLPSQKFDFDNFDNHSSVRLVNFKYSVPTGFFCNQAALSTSDSPPSAEDLEKDFCKLDVAALVRMFMARQRIAGSLDIDEHIDEQHKTYSNAFSSRLDKMLSDRVDFGESKQAEKDIYLTLFLAGLREME